MTKITKRLKKISENYDQEKEYSLNEAIDILKKNALCKFDETVEIAVNLNIDSKKAEQNVRGMVNMPSGIGKNIRVAVFAKDEAADQAKKAGADLVGAEDLIEEVNSGKIEFDLCISTPNMMSLVGRLGKVLGPRGLMPNPKLGTVTQDVSSAVKAAKSGQVEYRNDKNGIIHAGLGKASFAKESIKANIDAFVDALVQAKPTEVKSNYIKNVTLSTTMGKGVKVDVTSFAGKAGV